MRCERRPSKRVLHRSFPGHLASRSDEAIVAAQHTIYISLCENRRPPAGRRAQPEIALRARKVVGTGPSRRDERRGSRIVGTEAVPDEILPWLMRYLTPRA